VTDFAPPPLHPIDMMHAEIAHNKAQCTVVKVMKDAKLYNVLGVCMAI